MYEQAPGTIIQRHQRGLQYVQAFDDVNIFAFEIVRLHFSLIAPEKGGLKFLILSSSIFFYLHENQMQLESNYQPII